MSSLSRDNLIHKLLVYGESTHNWGDAISDLLVLALKLDYIDDDCQVLFKSLLDAGLINQSHVREKVLDLWVTRGSASLEQIKVEESKTEAEEVKTEEDKTEEDKTEEDKTEEDKTEEVN